MSNDMSMFKKMKERFTDEVNSATNKLQNMQIIDQLTTTIGQQMKNDQTPNQLLPEPHEIGNFISASSSASNSSSNVMSKTVQFSLIDDGPICEYNKEEDDELNSEEISPQHQLFNEDTIRKINSSNGIANTRHDNYQVSNINDKSKPSSHQVALNSKQSPDAFIEDNFQSVIDVDELSSDLEDGLELDDRKEGLDVDIDLLTDKSTPSNDKFNGSALHEFKSKYRNVVHALRKLKNEFEAEKIGLERQKQNLTNEITTLRAEMDNLKQRTSELTNHHDSLTSVATNISDNDKRSISPQPPGKSSTKVKDLERLLAKCKESLKQKNSQIQALKESLCEVEKYKEFNQELKQEMAELKESHETWTVSIAENKRIMHEEIESKNAEMERFKAETNDANSKIRQLKAKIQELESCLVSTSAAHQKERESLTKDLTISKNNAIKQCQREQEHNIERIKLDFEKSIELLKLEILNKDSQIIKDAERLQRMADDSNSLAKKLDKCNHELEDQQKAFNDLTQNHEGSLNKCSLLENELSNLKNQLAGQNDEFSEKNEELTKQLEHLTEKISSLEVDKSELERQIKEFLDGKTSEPMVCEQCHQYEAQISSEREKFQQELHELNAKLELMTSANEDQEKDIKSLTYERDTSTENYRALKSEFDELIRKNESLARVIQENETDMQSQQVQIDYLTAIEQELDLAKKENSSILEGLSRSKSELEEKTNDLNLLRSHNDDLNQQLIDLKIRFDNTQKLCDEMRKEKESLISTMDRFHLQKRQADEQLVIGILAAMRNLETPNTSPGSDKSFKSTDINPDRGVRNEDENKSEESLPDPALLMRELSSVALDRCHAYLTATQRLQAVMLDNSMMAEDLKRLRDELNNLNHVKSLESQSGIEEAEKLMTENQALIHDQQSYDERISGLESEIENLTEMLADRDKLLKMEEQKGSSNETTNGPDSTEFEYLKNIVHQFMLGREPLVLARVISAVFKFDKNQVDQICKVQEAVQYALANKSI